MRTRVNFNGFDLTKLCHVSDLRETLLPRSISSADVPGRDGSMLTGVTLSERVITLTVTLMGRNLEERRASARMLAAILNVDSAKPLAISIDGGLYYMAIPNANANGILSCNATRYDVTFRCVDPVAYGAEHIITVPSGGSVTFSVGGTYPTMPTVSAPAAANGSGGFWRLRMEDGSYLLATIPSGVTTAPVIADCERRTLKVNGSTALLVPAADWLVFEPGQHTIEMVGTGAATVVYRERWL